MRRTTLAFSLLVSTHALAADGGASEPAAQSASAIDQSARIAALERAVSDLMKEKGETWLTEQRAADIRAVVADVLADTDSRASLQAANATAGYQSGKGFFMASPDGNFRLNVGGQLQTRWAYDWLSSRSMANSQVFVAPPGAYFNYNQAGVTKAANGFEIRRAKVDFTGHVVDPSWQYAVELSYQQFFGTNVNSAGGSAYSAQTPGPYANGGGVSGGDNYAGSFSLENAYIRKVLANGFSLRVGQFKSPLLREWLVSSKQQLAVERSLVNTLFSTGWTQGIELDWETDVVRALVSYNDGANNANLGSTSGSQVAYFTNSGAGFTSWAATARAEWKPFGTWSQFDFMNSMRGESQGLMLGVAANLQRGGQQDDPATANPDPAENGNADASYATWTADATWHIGGASLMGAWMMNTAYDQSNGLASINTYGALVQGSMFVTDAVELFARWEWYCISNDVGLPATNRINNNTANTVFGNQTWNAAVNNIGTVGGNWYLSGRALKFTADLGVAWNPVTFQSGLFGQDIAGADYRVEGSGGGGQIVGRAQVQLLF